MKAAFIAFAAIVFAAVLLSAEPPVKPVSHRDCLWCHAPGQAEKLSFSWGESTSHNAQNSKALKPNDDVCRSCHDGLTAPPMQNSVDLLHNNHPIGVRVETTGFISLPLQDGRITCITCHDPHAEKLRSKNNDATSLCRNCHNK